MPRPKTGDKRAAILHAATRTMAKDGLGASTASVAKAAAVAEGSLFRYFPDKDKLLNELYRELKLDMRSTMITSTTELSAYVLEPIREGPDFTLYRGRQHGNPSRVLAVALAAEHPSPQ